MDRRALAMGRKCVFACGLAAFLAVGCNSDDDDSSLDPGEVQQGQQIFRNDTFGNEQLWTDTLRMHEVIASSVSPQLALQVGLKVDSDVLPPGILDQVDLTAPATTVALLSMDAVVGLKGRVENGQLVSVGITCAMCHSTVDNSVAPGIGKRLDGWPNRDLDPGLIMSLSPAMADPAKQAVLKSWGPGRYDAYWNHDGINNPQVIPPAYGLLNVPLETFTGEGPVSYWNNYVAVTQMGGQGDFTDRRLGITVDHDPDLVTSKLPALRAYQLSIPAPTPPPGSFDAAAAQRGSAVFGGKARCVTCHSGTAFTDATQRLHAPAEVGTDPTLANRATTKMYRTTPLRGVWQHPPYFHDGSAATLVDVVDHYNQQLQLGLSAEEAADLEQYLKSL
jgi:mono/diheme cytochrome c family protein